MPELVIKATDLRSVKYCVQGSKDFLARYGMDWRTFVKDGYTAEHMLKQSNNDAMVQRLVADVKKRRGLA